MTMGTSIDASLVFELITVFIEKIEWNRLNKDVFLLKLYIFYFSLKEFSSCWFLLMRIDLNWSMNYGDLLWFIRCELYILVESYLEMTCFVETKDWIDNCWYRLLISTQCKKASSLSYSWIRLCLAYLIFLKAID